MIWFLPSSVIQEQCTSSIGSIGTHCVFYTLTFFILKFSLMKFIRNLRNDLPFPSNFERTWYDCYPQLLWNKVTVAKSTAVDFFLPNNSEYCIKWIESVPSYAESSHSGVVVAEKGLGSRHILQSTAPRSCSCRYVYIQTVRAQKQLCDKQSCLLGNAKRCMYS